MPQNKGPWGAPTPPTFGPPLPPALVRRLSIGGPLVIAAAILVLGSVYVVQPTEMAGVRRLGTVVTDRPIGPGLHAKFPLVDVVDTIQTSLDTFRLNNLTVYTIDNQAVTVSLGISYRIPASAVLKLLYGVGRSGNVDITENIRPVLADRVLRVFATQNTVGISANREQIAAQITRNVAEALRSIFGIEIDDLQLSSITYSASFQASVEAAVQAKNDAIRAENTVAKVRYEGEQAKVQAAAQAAVRIAQANGEAEAAVAQARAQREASILRAEGAAQATTLTGEAEAKIIQQVGSAVASNPGVVAYETAHRWNGTMPATMLGGSNPLTLLNLPGAGETRPNAPQSP
ncbi:SPFH domain-containing protein [uncultured Methylobacterium sp.]|uniref:SPFH domain-containing protein n=1 Tax=uncultured Methylobacterium sp. TaxID=157278 RepID=UPI0035CB8448